MKIVALLLVSFITNQSIAACPVYNKLFGVIDLKKKIWSTSKVDTKPRELCNEIPHIPNANLEITFKKDDKVFTTNIYRSLRGYWDHPENNGSFTGGTMPLTIIEVNTFIPDWYEKSTMTIKDKQSNKTLAEAKL